MSNRIENFETNLAKLLFVYYFKLNSIIESYGKQDIKFLFLPRAGITIKKQLNQFRKIKNLSQFGEDHLFWINRATAGAMIQDDTTYLRFLNEQIGKSSQRKYESLIRSFSVSLKDIPFKDVNIQHIEYLVKYTRRKRVENFTIYKN